MIALTPKLGVPIGVAPRSEPPSAMIFVPWEPD